MDSHFMIRALDKWLLPYLLQHPRLPTEGQLRVFIVICDHFEPFHATDLKGALSRMQLWQDEYPKLQHQLLKSTGLKIRHSFFYPIEQYHAEIIDRLADICTRADCETEVHLHHHNDTAQHVRECLIEGKDRLAGHGLLSRSADGEIRYGFIHGNWALDHSDPSGKNCGVPNELGILRETGCYADFTMPSAPHGTQTRTVNSIYYGRDTPAAKSHDYGVAASPQTAGLRQALDHLLLIQGPLAINWRRRKWGLLPKIENADLTGANPPTVDRFQLWKRQGIHVASQPRWIFVKLHTHGAIPENSPTLLGSPMKTFVEGLRTLIDQSNGRLLVDFITARQAANLVHAAEDGLGDDPSGRMDYLYRKS